LTCGVIPAVVDTGNWTERHPSQRPPRTLCPDRGTSGRSARDRRPAVPERNTADSRRHRETWGCRFSQSL